MIIGIDLDNTIIDYSNAFYAIACERKLLPNHDAMTKTQLRDYLREQPEGEITWQCLQAEVYGPRLPTATVMAGFLETYRELVYNENQLIVLSHKTQYAAQDLEQACDLHQASLQWLAQHNLAFDTVCFYATRGEKVRAIDTFHCDIFIDDLEEVLRHREFPQKTVPLLLNSASCSDETYCKRFEHWNEIHNFIQKEYPQALWKQHVLTALSVDEATWDSQVGGMNSRVYRVTLPQGGEYCVKRYPCLSHDTRNRRMNEYDAFVRIRQAGINCVPNTVSTLPEINSSIFSWQPGEKLSPEEVNKEHIDEIITVLTLLQEKQNQIDWPRDRLASEATFSLAELEAILELRHARLSEVQSEDASDQSMLHWLDSDFTAMQANALHRASNLYKSVGLGKETLLEQAQRILSPSDLGFHNTLSAKGHSLCFIDFEYFGWDDPVKTLCDFILHPHPNMQVSPELKAYFAERFMETSVCDAYFQERLQACFPLYVLKWTYIILNPFLPEKRLLQRSTEFDRATSLERAKVFSEKVNLDNVFRADSKIK